jgi:hypothetical protein
MNSLQTLSFLKGRLKVYNLSVFKYGISESEMDVLGKVKGKFTIMLFGMRIGQSEADKAPAAYL